MPNGVRVRILNVGQGDAIVGVLPGGDRAFVVDVFDADRVLDFLTDEGITEVVLFLSHSDRDHTAGAAQFIADFPREGRILGIFYNHDRLNARKESEYVRLTQLIGGFSRAESRRDPDYLYCNFNTNLNAYPPFANLFPPGCTLRVLHPELADQSSLVGQDTNETAGILMVECEVGGGKSRRVLLGADIQLTGISLLMHQESAEAIRADVLKFPHHGAWPEEWPGITSVGVPKRTLQDFLEAVAPSAVIISAGFRNPHGHVREEVFTLLEAYSRSTGQLTAVKCTQFTDTCVRGPRLPYGASLAEPHCAGDVEISLSPEVDPNGIEILTYPDDHAARVAEVHRVGNARCVFLRRVSI